MFIKFELGVMLLKYIKVKFEDVLKEVYELFVKWEVEKSWWECWVKKVFFKGK